MINLTNIFDMFDNPNKSDNESDETSLLIDFSDHPLYWINGFTKIINNHVFFNQYIIKTFKNIPLESDVNITELEQVGMTLIYNKAWNYIKNMNLSNPLHIECLKTKNSEELIMSLKSAIVFFEELEEYEKCELLKNIEIKLKDFNLNLA